MASKPTTFAILQGFLERLGFQYKVIPGSHLYFQHPSTGALIPLRLYQPEEELGATDRALVRRVLDDYGLVDRDRFDLLLQDQPVAG
jgi:predicted RNA binding protein YcfA (HicA-like mRNA interferase family)